MQRFQPDIYNELGEYQRKRKESNSLFMQFLYSIKINAIQQEIRKQNNNYHKAN